MFAVLPQGGVDRRLVVRQADRQFDRGKLVGKRRPERLLVDVFLQTANADFDKMSLVGRVHFDRHLESDGIQKFQQTGKADGLAIVWCG